MISVAFNPMPKVLHFSGNRLPPITDRAVLCGGIGVFRLMELFPAAVGQPALVVVDPLEDTLNLVQPAVCPRDIPVDAFHTPPVPDLHPIRRLMFREELRAEGAVHVRSRELSQDAAPILRCRSILAPSSPRYMAWIFFSQVAVRSAIS